MVLKNGGPVFVDADSAFDHQDPVLGQPAWRCILPSASALGVHTFVNQQSLP